MTKVKICGITRLQDAQTLVKNGVDALGLVFYPNSPRNIDIPTAQQIVASLPPFITVVGLFCNPTACQVEQVIANVALDCLQFHGDEQPDFCQQFNYKYIKALHVSSNTSELIPKMESYSLARAILLDTFVDGIKGGTGKTFDWSLIPASSSQPLIIAGGINPTNVKKLVSQYNPYAVDLSSGVEETNMPGVKSHAKIIALMQQINSTH